MLSDDMLRFVFVYGARFADALVAHDISDSEDRLISSLTTGLQMTIQFCTAVQFGSFYERFTNKQGNNYLLLKRDFRSKNPASGIFSSLKRIFLGSLNATMLFTDE